MARCIYCDRFSFSLDSGVCKKCYCYYANSATYFVETELKNAFIPVDDIYASPEDRIKALNHVKKIFSDFLNSNSGSFCQLFDPNCIRIIQLDIEKTDRELSELIDKRNKHKQLMEDLEKRRFEEMKKYPKKTYTRKVVKQFEDMQHSSKTGFKESYSKIEGTPDNYIVFDLETTGFNKTDDEILEIGAIRYVENVEQERFHSYVNPHRSIPKAASAVNHITQAKVKNAPDIDSVIMDFYVFIGELPLIAYNSDFDMNFIQWKSLLHLGKRLENDTIDALPLARKYLTDLPNKKLETVKQHFELNVGSHNAIDDCIVTNHLYQYCKGFEELTYRYVIPFSFNPTELNEKEIIYLEEIVKICEANGIDIKNMSMYKNSSYLSIEANGIFIARLKLFSKLQYVLLNVPYQDFCNNNNTSIKYSQAGKGQEKYTRVFPETPEQLWELQGYIPTISIKSWINNR